ncbi:hypothetical protein HN011_010010, partial [Eciton burchellii]
CACSLAISMSNFRANALKTVQVDCLVLLFSQFLQASYLVYTVSPCSSPDSGPSCDILDLADAANSIPQSGAP